MGPQEHEVERNPYHRIHQEKLLYFRDEVSCIQKVLHDQLERMRDIEIACWPSDLRWSLSNDKAILKESMQSTEERITSFEEMNSRAINIGTYVSPRRLIVPVPAERIFNQTLPDQITEHPAHRSNQRPPRSRYPCLHSRNNYLPSFILHFFAFRHEYIRHT